MNNSMGGDPTSSWFPIKRNGKVRTIFALAALIAALTPGWLGWLDKTDETARLKAELSEKKAELAYLLIKQRLEFMEKRLVKVENGMDMVADDLREIRVFVTGQSRKKEGVGAPSVKSLKQNKDVDSGDVLSLPSTLDEANDLVNSGRDVPSEETVLQRDKDPLPIDLDAAILLANGSS